MNKTVEAHAKINLYLDITGKRENGYHDICGVMHKISLSDTVSVTAEKAIRPSICVTCSDPSIPLGASNIAYRAAERYIDRFCSDNYCIDIHIEKRIPAAGGLAGGSTDAAAVLLCLRDMIGKSSENELYSLGAGLGADVPFCMADGTMITEGIGDILTPCPSLGNCTLVICNTGEAVSTPEAYGKLDMLYNNFSDRSFDRKRFSCISKGLSKGDLKLTAKSMYNIFEDAVLPTRPKAKGAKELMTAHGAVGAMMSGSGPTIFGIFDSIDNAQSAYGALRALGYSTHICKAI